MSEGSGSGTPTPPKRLPQQEIISIIFLGYVCTIIIRKATLPYIDATPADSTQRTYVTSENVYTIKIGKALLISTLQTQFQLCLNHNHKKSNAMAGCREMST
jgi:hypothetical protein